MLTRKKCDVIVKFVVAVGLLIFLRTVVQLNHISNDKSGANSQLVENLFESEESIENGHHFHGREADQRYVAISNETYSKVISSFQSVHRDTEYEDMKRIVRDLVVSTSVCPNLTRPREITYAPTGKFWQMNRWHFQEIHVISAFYDDRPPVGIIPYVRLLTVSTLPKNGTAYCQIWYDGLENPYIVPVKIHSSGRGEKVVGIRYGQWLYSCKLPSSLPVPTHVSVAFEKCQDTNMNVPIYVPVRSPWQHEFGVCVAIAFGKVDFEIFVEWVEMNKYFGVTEINIYNASMSDDMNKVFDFYKDQGILRVHHMPPPQPDYSKKGSKLSSPASLNDCMLRNAYRYRYMVVIDFDEVVVPKKLTNYSAMLEEINKANKLSGPWISYTFRNEFYFYEYEDDKTQPQYLRMMRFREHAKPNRYLFAPKSFVDPLQCLSLFNHYCYIRFPGSPKKFTIDVDTNIATSHHYKKCGFGKGTCKEYAEEKTKEDYILAIAEEMKKAVSQALYDIGLLTKEEMILGHKAPDGEKLTR